MRFEFYTIEKEKNSMLHVLGKKYKKKQFLVKYDGIFSSGQNLH